MTLSSMPPLRRRLLRERFVTLLKAADPGAVDPGAASAVGGGVATGAAGACRSLAGRLDGVFCSVSMPPPAATTAAAPVPLLLLLLLLLQGEEDGDDDLNVSHW